MKELDQLSNEELMQTYSQILDELNQRKVVRTYNSPVGDYAEWLVCNQLNYEMQRNSTKGYDALDKATNQRIQIKSRWVRGKLNQIQLSPIRERDLSDFDQLIIVLFASDFSILKVLKMENYLVTDYGKWRDHLNGYLVRISRSMLSDERVEDITGIFL